MDGGLARPANPSPPSRVGIAYMMGGRTPRPAGASNIDPSATEPTADNAWVVRGAPTS